jgi:hypothetical protein
MLYYLYKMADVFEEENRIFKLVPKIRITDEFKNVT